MISISRLNKKKTKETNQQKFKRLLDIARDLIVEYNHHCRDQNQIKLKEHPLIAYITLLGRRTQADALLNNFEGKEREINAISYYEFMRHRVKIGKYKYCNPFSFLKKKQNGVTITLAKNLILPCPWNEQRLVSCLSHIYQWEENELNHRVEVWQPVGIAWVSGGNHSIATGVLKGDGYIKNPYVVDMTNMYKYISTDGVAYYNLFDGSKICSVRNVEFAVIFEIGRLMVEKGIGLIEK